VAFFAFLCPPERSASSLFIMLFQSGRLSFRALVVIFSPFQIDLPFICFFDLECVVLVNFLQSRPLADLSISRLIQGKKFALLLLPRCLDVSDYRAVSSLSLLLLRVFHSMFSEAFSKKRPPQWRKTQSRCCQMDFELFPFTGFLFGVGLSPSNSILTITFPSFLHSGGIDSSFLRKDRRECEWFLLLLRGVAKLFCASDISPFPMFCCAVSSDSVGDHRCSPLLPSSYLAFLCRASLVV